MRTVVIALASVAILTAPAYAQMRGKGGKHSGSEQQTAEQKQKAAEAEKAYRAVCGSARGARRPPPTHESDDRPAVAGDRAIGDAPAPSIRDEMVVGDRG